MYSSTIVTEACPAIFYCKCIGSGSSSRVRKVWRRKDKLGRLVHLRADFGVKMGQRRPN